MEDVAPAMLLGSTDLRDLLSTLAPAHDTIFDSRHLNQGTRGSADWLPIEEAIAGYLKYPSRSFLVDFCMHRESFWILVDWVESNHGGWCVGAGGASPEVIKLFDGCWLFDGRFRLVRVPVLVTYTPKSSTPACLMRKSVWDILVPELHHIHYVTQIHQSEIALSIVHPTFCVY